MLLMGKTILTLLSDYARMPRPLLSGVILQKLGTHLILGNPLPNILTLLSKEETLILEEPNWLDLVNPEIWATEVPGRANNATPVKIQLKDLSHYPH